MPNLKLNNMEKFNNFLVPVLVGCIIGLNVALHFVQKNVEELQKEVDERWERLLELEALTNKAE